ncbi:MAG TPA: hypothetical protein VFO65_13215, partial [Acidimicrobiales bacterium]|nr:hypothetical protein [Acidimicrobiales bacterium]
MADERVDRTSNGGPAAAPDDGVHDDDDGVHDELPEDLDVTGYRGVYTFPDNSRRRIPGVIHLGIAAACLALWATKASGGVLVN